MNYNYKLTTRRVRYWLSLNIYENVWKIATLILIEERSRTRNFIRIYFLPVRTVVETVNYWAKDEERLKATVEEI